MRHCLHCRIRRFFTEIDYDQQKLAEFEDIHREFNNRLEEWIKNNGGVFQQPIPAGITEKIFECDVEWILKLLMLTNKLEDRSVKNIFSFPPSKGTILIDRISINRDTDEYFTYTRQQNIQIAASIGAVLIMEIFENEKYLDEFINWVIAALKYISDHCKLRDEEIDIDFLTMVESLQFVDAVRK